jgi:release factor glutamine methyltransferase
MEKEIGWLLKEKYHCKPDKNFYRDVNRLEAGEPADYVIGFTNFLGCKVDLSKKTLIPRADTEFWVSETLKSVNKGKVLDLFAGSGCIGIAVLKHKNNILCDFVDSEKNAISQIKINLKLNKINPTRYKIIQSDVFSKIKGKYDYIFANPPYVAIKRKNKVQPAVLKYEPKTALFAGDDGLFYIKKFLGQAVNHLNPGGKIFMEFGSEQKKEIEKIIKKCNYSEFKFYKDQCNKWRWVVVFK